MEDYKRKPGDLVAMYRGIIKTAREKISYKLKGIDEMIHKDNELSDDEKKALLKENASFKYNTNV